MRGIPRRRADARPPALGAALAAVPEMGALLRLLRADAPAALPADVDAEKVVALASYHKVLGHVVAARSELPASVTAEIRERSRALVQRQLLLVSLQDQVLAALRAEGIPARPLKGPSLSTWLFGDPARRTSGDVDVLVPPTRALDALAVLQANGFAPLRERTLDFEALQAARVKDFELTHTVYGLPLELHWGLSSDYALPALRDAVLPGQADREGLGAPEAVAAYVLLHGAWHGFEKLAWVVDAAALGGRLSDAEWAGALAIARADRMESGFLLGPYLAEHLLGVPVPGPLREPMHRRARRLRRLADRCLIATEPGTVWPTSAFLAIQGSLPDSRRARARFIGMYLLRPTTEDAGVLDGPFAGLRRRGQRPLSLVRKTAEAVRRRLGGAPEG